MLNFSEIDQLIKVAFYAYGENGRVGLPLFFVSPPGEAKTSKVRGVARAAGVWFGALEGSRLDAVDVAGLPKFSDDGRSFRFVPPAVLRDAADAGDGLLFLDELTRAPASVQAAFLTLLLEGRTEGVQLPPGVRIMAAANPAASVGGVELDPANASRLIWIDWPAMDADEFTAYLLGADTVTGEARRVPIDHAAEAERLERDWPANMMRARGAVAGFLASKGSLLREPAPEQARGWSNPRTWSMATRALAACYMHGASERVLHTLLAGALGAGTATAFAAWLRSSDLPSARDVLAGKAALPLDARRKDRTLSVLAECIAIGNVQDHGLRLWELVGEAATVSPELTVLSIRMLKARDMGFLIVRSPAKVQLLTNPAFSRIMEEVANAKP